MSEPDSIERFVKNKWLIQRAKHIDSFIAQLLENEFAVSDSVRQNVPITSTS